MIKGLTALSAININHNKRQVLRSQPSSLAEIISCDIEELDKVEFMLSLKESFRFKLVILFLPPNLFMRTLIYHERFLQ